MIPSQPPRWLRLTLWLLLLGFAVLKLTGCATAHKPASRAAQLHYYFKRDCIIETELEYADDHKHLKPFHVKPGCIQSRVEAPK